MSLKEITKDLHTEAEKTKFAKLLLSGDITREDYANYLYQMTMIYPAIEYGCHLQGFLNDLPGIDRTTPIMLDYLELAGQSSHYPYKFLPSVKEYHNYLGEMIDDPTRRHLILAHLYVRHMGDLFGGQFIAQKVPGSGLFYKFDNVDELKAVIYNKLTDDLGDEARVAFEWAIKIMRELGNE